MSKSQTEGPGRLDPAAGGRSWAWGVGPAYIGLFLGVPYLDPICRSALPMGGLAPAVVGAAAAGLACYLLLDRPGATWGLRSRRTLDGLASHTFGLAGGRWLTALAMGLAQVGWIGLSVDFGVESTLRGLASLGMVGPSVLAPWAVGGRVLRSPTWLATGAFWAVAAALIGHWLSRLIAALMNIYPAFLALALGGLMVWSLPGLAAFRPSGLDPRTGLSMAEPEVTAGLRVLQYAFAFFGLAALAAPDWGAASRDGRDVRLGGLVGVGSAAFLLAAIALIAVAGTPGRRPASASMERALEVQSALPQATMMRPGGGPVVDRARRDLVDARGEPYSLVFALQEGLGGRAGGAALLLFGLGAMAPAVYAPFAFGARLHALIPAVPRLAWSLLTPILALPLIALRASTWAGPLVDVIGALTVPIAGALAADALRHRARWPGLRDGVSFAGLSAWAAGAAVGLLPTVGPRLRLGPWSDLRLPAVGAFAVAFAVNYVFTTIGLTSRASALTDPPIGR